MSTLGRARHEESAGSLTSNALCTEQSALWHCTSGLGSSPATRSRSGPFGLRTACAAKGAPEGLTMPKEPAATWGSALRSAFKHLLHCLSRTAEEIII